MFKNNVDTSIKDLALPPAEHGIVILLDPPSYHYHNNRFFDLNTPLNRDQTLKPNLKLKQTLERAGYPVFTADLFHGLQNVYGNCEFHYWGFGSPAARALKLSGRGLKKMGVVLFEPPLIKPRDYKHIPKLLASFDNVFLHNTIGDGYSLPPNDSGRKLKKFYWTNRKYSSACVNSNQKKRLSKIALIAGAHFTKAKYENGYGKRLEAVKKFTFEGSLDLFGFGWNRIQLRSPFISAYWYLRLVLARVVVTQPSKKSDVYRNYDFSLCFENMAMSGYITEKIFDSLFSRCIPIYWGAPDIKEYIPENCFIDLNDFKNIEECVAYCNNLNSEEKEIYRIEIDRFLESDNFKKFKNGIHGFLSDFYLADRNQR